MNYTFTEIARIVDGQIIGSSSCNPDETIEKIYIDSRKINAPGNAVFIALKGKEDGHQYIEKAYKKGVKYFLVEHVPFSNNDAYFLQTADTLKALQKWAVYHRKKFQKPLIAITGSNGKTIVKEWLFQCLSTKFKIVRNPKSYNSQIGVPLSVLRIMPGQHDLGIFEAGISLFGEMEKLQNILQPDIGIFTNLGSAHDEGFHSREEKLAEKLKLFSHSKHLIFQIGKALWYSKIIHTFCKKNDILPFTWSFDNSTADVLLSVTAGKQSSKIQVQTKQNQFSVDFPFTDEASLQNIGHVITAMIFMNIPPEIIQQKVAQIYPVSMRLELFEGNHKNLIINDSYNADTESLNIALDFLRQQAGNFPKIIVLSDFEQLQLNDVQWKKLAREINHLRPSLVIGVGEKIQQLKPFLSVKSLFFSSTQELLQNHLLFSAKQTAILLKGARKFRFEKIAARLIEKKHVTRLEINLSALKHNIDFFRSKIPPSTRIMFMIKAFSYGAGIREIAKFLNFCNIDYFGVAYIDEALAIRNVGVNKPILVLNPDKNSYPEIIRYQLEPEIYSIETLENFYVSLMGQLLKTDAPYPIHLKIDTGMHRLGFSKDEISLLIDKLKAMPYLKVKGIFTHLIASENPEHDTLTKKQLQLFEKISKEIEHALGYETIKHALNSNGILRFSSAGHEMVRLGIGAYGVGIHTPERKKLKSVLAFKTQIAQVKTIEQGETVGYGNEYKAPHKMKIAIVSAGYADGIRRICGNGNWLFQTEQGFVPTIGNICMDMTMLDITGKNLSAGDDVYFFSSNEDIEHLAKLYKSIPYEVLTSIGERVSRVYHQDEG